MPFDCTQLAHLAEIGALAAEVTFHDRDGFRRIQVPITSHGVGLFSATFSQMTGRTRTDFHSDEADYTDGKGTEHTHWESVFFSFGGFGQQTVRHPPAINVPLRLEMPRVLLGQLCDQRLGQIFGGEGTVFATDRDPDTLRLTDGRPHRGAGRNRLNVRGEDPRGGVAHIYATATGAGVARGNLFTPDGFRGSPESNWYYRDRYSDEVQNYHRFTYLPGSLRRFGYSGGLVVSFIHTGPTDSSGVPYTLDRSTRNSAGSILIGVIGAFGNPVEVGGSGDGYNHTHIRFYRADRRGRMGSGIDPRSVFCGDLGF